MANTDNPNGFLPYLGKAKVHYYDLLATNAVIGVGDPLIHAAAATGYLDRATAAGSVIVGVAAEPKAANAGGKIAVWDDPDQLFVAQTDDGTGTATAQTCVGLNVNMVVGAGSNGRSIFELDESTADTTATLVWKIIRLSDEVGNAFGEFNRLVVKPNNHKMIGGTGTLGV